MTLGVRPRRDAEAPGLGTRRAGHALLIHPKGRVNAQAVAFAEGLPADPDHQVVVLDLPADPGDATWAVVARLLGRGHPGGYRLVTGRTLPGGMVPVGQWLADRLDRAVVVPDGAPVPAAGGVLYIPADRGPGWVRLLPRRPPTPVSRRFPAPYWEFTLSDRTWRTSDRAVVDPLPSGVWLHGDGQGGALSPHRDLLVSRLAYRRDLLTVVLGCPGGDELPLDDVTRFWHSLLPGVRDLVRFVTYGPLAVPDGSGPGQALADRLGVPVTFDNGLPVSHAVGETPEVHALDADGTPGWAAFARQLRFTPAQLTGGLPTAPVVVGHRPVFDDLPETAPGRYRYDDAVLEVVPSGLWLRPSSESGEAGDAAEAAAIRSAAPSARHVNVVFGTGGQGGGRMRELAERLLQRLDPALRAMARLVPAVQLVRETSTRELTTGTGAESAGGTGAGARAGAGAGRRTVAGGHAAGALDDAPATVAAPPAAGPRVRLATAAPVLGEAPAERAPGAAFAGTTPTGIPGQVAGAVAVASAGEGTAGPSNGPVGTGPGTSVRAAGAAGVVPAGEGTAAPGPGARGHVPGAAPLPGAAPDDRGVPAPAGPRGPDAPGLPPLLWESSTPAPGATAPRPGEFATPASGMPSRPGGPAASAGLPPRSSEFAAPVPGGPPSGAGVPVVPVSGGLPPRPEASAAPTFQGAPPQPGESAAPVSGSGPSGAGVPVVPLSDGLPPRSTESAAPTFQGVPPQPGESAAPTFQGAPPQAGEYAGPGPDGMPSPAGEADGSVPDGGATAGRPANPLPPSLPLPSLRLVSAPGLPAPPPVNADGAAPDAPGSGLPDRGADARPPASSVPGAPANPAPPQPAPPSAVPTPGPGAAPAQAVPTAPDAGPARAGAVPGSGGPGAAGTAAVPPAPAQGGTVRAGAGARVQAVPSPAASAVPPRDGIAREREWLRGAFRQQYNDGAGAVARLLSESPGLRGSAQTPTEDVLTDLVAARLYLRGDSALLDRQIRAASVGPHIPFARCVAAGLRRLPSYRGATMLRATLGDAEWDWYRRRTLVTEWAFCWALTSGTPEVPGDADLLIWSMTARRTALLDPDQPARVLFLPGTTFKVLAVRDGDRRTVLLRELSASEISADGRVDTGRTALDDMALSGLEQADRTWQGGETGTAPSLTPEQAVRFTAPPGLVLPPQPNPPAPPGKRTTP
ncbi:hypothetical protein ACFY8B_25865 [Streptomyces sp. NPDC012751]|uniref:hypothetical protein n=1 Tax=Streptomyces sp. NPDC012751 TaxID=3364846 RepID=UPI00368B5EC6